MAAPMSFVYAAATRRLDRIVALLEQAPEGMTRQQLAKATSITYGAIGLYLNELGGTETAPRRIRIGRWVRQLGNRGNFTPFFFAGDAGDEQRPAALTNAQRTKRYRMKQRKEKSLG
jgi:hypothetical protein